MPTSPTHNFVSLHLYLFPSNFPDQIQPLEDCLDHRPANLVLQPAASRYSSIPTNMSLLSLVLGNVLMLSRTLPRSTSRGPVVPLADHVRLLGVTLDYRLSVDI